MDKEFLKNIARKRISLRKIIPYQIYIDMDSVLTDFLRAFKDIGKGDLRDLSSKERWNIIDAQGLSWWSDMPWMIDGKMLWNFVKKFKPIVLSAPSNKIESKIGKMIWVRKQLGKGIPLELKKAEDKKHFSHNRAILIDDMPDNINSWRAEGGIGILHKSAKQTIEELKKLGF